MLDLSNSHKIVICPGYTDMRLGIIGLSGLIDKPENGCSYIFCGSKGRTIKVIEFCAGSVWIHTKKSLCGKFVWPTEGSVQNISIETFKLLTETVDEMAKLKNSGKIPSIIMKAADFLDKIGLFK